MRTSHPDAQAFHHLRRSLVRRRLAQLDLKLKLELGSICLLIIAFVFWQVRGSFASLEVMGGTRAVLSALASTWLVMIAGAAGLVAFRHARRLRVGPPGPAWLGLPIREPTLAHHLAWDSGAIATWMWVPAIGVWSAAWGLVPRTWSLALAPVLAAGLIAAGRVGSKLGEWVARASVRGRGAGTLARVLARAATAARVHKIRAAGWTKAPAWRALATKDLLVTMRVGKVRRQLVLALAFWILSALAWRLPAPPHMTDLAYVSAFVLAMLGSAVLGEWLVSLSGADPFQALRSLPVGVAPLWGARFALALSATALLLVLHAFSAPTLTPHALRLFLAWSAGATLAIAALAVNYGVTLFPRADVAERLFGLSLGLAVAASLMIPLMGWIVLLSAVLHSARRLAHWSRLEEA